MLHDYFAWATTTTMSANHHSADDVPQGLSIPCWSWDGYTCSNSRRRVGQQTGNVRRTVQVLSSPAG